MQQVMLAEWYSPPAFKAFLHYHTHVIQVGYKMRFFGEDAGALPGQVQLLHHQ